MLTEEYMNKVARFNREWGDPENTFSLRENEGSPRRPSYEELIERMQHANGGIRENVKEVVNPQISAQAESQSLPTPALPEPQADE